MEDANRPHARRVLLERLCRKALSEWTENVNSGRESANDRKKGGVVIVLQIDCAQIMVQYRVPSPDEVVDIQMFSGLNER